jgi:hypothetical protein
MQAPNSFRTWWADGDKAADRLPEITPRQRSINTDADVERRPAMLPRWSSAAPLATLLETVQKVVPELAPALGAAVAAAKLAVPAA